MPELPPESVSVLCDAAGTGSRTHTAAVPQPVLPSSPSTGCSVGHGNQRIDVVQTEQSGENAGSERQFRLGRQVIPIFLQRNASFSQDTLIVYQFYAFLSNGREFDKNVNFSKSLLTFSGNVLK